MSPPGKLEGRNDVTVGGHDHAASGRDEEGVVVALRQPLVGEGAGEELLDQLRHRAAAAAVGHVDPAVLEVDRPDVVAADLGHCAAAHAARTSTSLKRP